MLSLISEITKMVLFLDHFPKMEGCLFYMSQHWIMLRGFEMDFVHLYVTRRKCGVSFALVNNMHGHMLKWRISGFDFVG